MLGRGLQSVKGKRNGEIYSRDIRSRGRMYSVVATCCGTILRSEEES